MKLCGKCKKKVANKVKICPSCGADVSKAKIIVINASKKVNATKKNEVKKIELPILEEQKVEQPIKNKDGEKKKLTQTKVKKSNKSKIKVRVVKKEDNKLKLFFDKLFKKDKKKANTKKSSKVSAKNNKKSKNVKSKNKTKKSVKSESKFAVLLEKLFGNKKKKNKKKNTKKNVKTPIKKDVKVKEAKPSVKEEKQDEVVNVEKEKFSIKGSFSKVKNALSSENIFSDDSVVEENEPLKDDSNYKKKLIVAIIIVASIVALFVGCVIVVSSHFNNNYDYEVSSDSKNNKFNIGDKILYKGIIYQIKSAYAVDGTDYKKPKEGNQFILVNISMENDDKKKVPYSYKNWKMSNSKNEESSRIFTPVNASTALYSGTLVIGSTKSGSLVFEQPKDDEKLELRFYEFENKMVEGKEEKTEKLIFTINIGKK